MPTYDPQITISAAPGITGYLRLALYEATAPNTEVAATAQLAPPHNASRQLQFIGLNPVIHIAKLFVTDGISTDGTVVANFSIDPRFPGVELKAPLFLYANASNGFDAGTNQFTDPDGELEGWDYEVEDRGFGTLDPVNELDKTSPGYRVTIPDYTLGENQLHIVRFAPKMITYSAGANTGGSLFGSVELITSSRALTSDDAGKQLHIASATSTITVTLPEIDSVVAGKLFMFTSNGGNHVNAVIETEGSDSEKIDWLNDELDSIILGQSESLWLYKWIDPDNSSNRRWKVMKASDGIAMVGERFYSDSTTALNALQAAGQLLDRDVYPRLWAYVQTLDASLLISDTTWNASDENKAKWSTGDGSTTFRMPKMDVYGHVKTVDGSTRKAGTYEAGQVGSHKHLTGEFSNATANDDWAGIVEAITNGDTHQLRSVTGSGPYSVASRTITANRATVTSANIASGSAVNTVPNTGLYMYIRI